MGQAWVAGSPGATRPCVGSRRDASTSRAVMSSPGREWVARGSGSFAVGRIFLGDRKSGNSRECGKGGQGAIFSKSRRDNPKKARTPARYPARSWTQLNWPEGVAANGVRFCHGLIDRVSRGQESEVIRTAKIQSAGAGSRLSGETSPASSRCFDQTIFWIERIL